MKKIGFIGTGNMGEAMITGLLNNDEKNFMASDISICDVDKSRLLRLNELFGFKYTTNPEKLAEMSDIIVLAIKPNVFDGVLSGIAGVVKDQLIISIAVGKTLAYIEKLLGSSAKIVRAMPNTPALVGQGMAALCANGNVTAEEMQIAVSIFETFGKAEVLSESLFSIFTAVSGSSPAYVFMFIEALADAAVLEGMPRELAYRSISQAILGSAEMALKTGKHPGELKDMVCSPGGTTIEAVAALERYGFRAAVINAVGSCAKKAENIGK